METRQKAGENLTFCQKKWLTRALDKESCLAGCIFPALPFSLFLLSETERMTQRKNTILYAEDDLDDLFIIKQAFQQHDHIEVIHATDGRVAITLLEAMAIENVLPCLVILDINMPVMNGKEALQAIRGHAVLHRLPVVLFSTSSSAADRVFAESYQAILVTKPAEFSSLETIVSQFIDQCNFEINNFSINDSYQN